LAVDFNPKSAICSLKFHFSEESAMVRSAVIFAAFFVPGLAVAQTTTTTTTPDGRTITVTTTQTLGGVNSVVIGPAQVDGAALPLPNGFPARDTAPATGTAVIRGRVLDASSGTPVRKASVRIFSPQIRENRSAVTDLEGRYEFTDLPAGQFNLNVTKTGYVDLGYGQTTAGEMGKTLKVADKQVVEKIDFALPRGAVITGRVLDEFGEPIADVQVSALRNQFTPSGQRPVNAGRFATTNDIGEFRLFGIPPGQYFLSASYRQMMTVGPMATVQGDTSGYAVTYYPGTANLADAQKLTIGLGGSVFDVTLMLVPTRTARISGFVLDGKGRPVKQGSVMVIPRSPAGGSIGSGGGMIRPDGWFTISNVAPGEYTLRGMTPGQPGSQPETAMATVSVNGIDLTDVQLEPVKPISVSGRVIMDPVAARTFKPEMMRLTAPPSEPGPFMGPMAPPAAVRDDLTFEFQASPGPSVVRLIGPAGWMIKSVSLNGADVTDGITFRNEGVSGLEVELTNKVPDLSGQVTNGNGDAVLDYFAIVFPQDQELWIAPGPGRTGMTRPDDQGRYRFRSLRPGNYYVVAVEHVQTGEWMDPTFMESIRSRATRVTLNEGDTLVTDLKLVQPR
jgi:protocatechuate 3,4-dioxygenase beta subunit